MTSKSNQSLNEHFEKSVTKTSIEQRNKKERTSTTFYQGNYKQRYIIFMQHCMSKQLYEEIMEYQSWRWTAILDVEDIKVH